MSGEEESRDGFRPIHLAVALVLVGVIAAIAVPNFLEFRLKAKTTEATSNLGAIRSTEVAYYAEWRLWVGNQPFTPVLERRGRPEPVQWDEGTRFSILGYAPEGPVFFSYALMGEDYPVAAAGFTALAQGDLDGDGKVTREMITAWPFGLAPRSRRTPSREGEHAF